MGVLKGWDKGKIGNSYNRKNEYIRRKQCVYTKGLEKNENKKEENKKKTSSQRKSTTVVQNCEPGVRKAKVQNELSFGTSFGKDVKK